jgi:hypothetical protein
VNIPAQDEVFSTTQRRLVAALVTQIDDWPKTDATLFPALKHRMNRLLRHLLVYTYADEDSPPPDVMRLGWEMDDYRRSGTHKSARGLARTVSDLLVDVAEQAVAEAAGIRQGQVRAMLSRPRGTLRDAVHEARRFRASGVRNPYWKPRRER